MAKANPETRYRDMFSATLDNIQNENKRKNKDPQITSGNNRLLAKNIISQFPPNTEFTLTNFSKDIETCQAVLIKTAENGQIIVRLSFDSKKHNLSPIYFCELTGLANLSEDKTKLIPNQEMIDFYLDLNTTKPDQLGSEFLTGENMS